MIDPVDLRVQDVSSRTILYARAPQVRTRLNAVYTVSMFAGGGLSTVAVGACWTIGGWTGICWFGGGAAAAIAAARGARSAHALHPSQDAGRTAVGHPDS